MAINFTHSYHLGIFVCCRELEKKEYNYYTTLEAQKILAETLKSVEQNLPIVDRLRPYNPPKIEEINNELTPAEETKEAGRGRDALASPLQCSNFAMIYGTKLQN